MLCTASREMKQKQPKPQWNAWELHLLRSKYPLHGAVGTASMLPRRTPDAVKAKAYSMGLNVGNVNGWVPTGHIAQATGLHATSVRERALASGYAKCLKLGGRRLILVPEAWANAYITMTNRAREAEELMGHHYTTDQVARIFGVHRTTIKRWLYGIPPGSPGVKHLSRVRVVSTGGRGRRQYLFDPYHAEKEARAYREHQRRQLRPEQD